jgi:endonuclease/exonuclease/phosphatase family metal-dependent hydrolase
MHGAGLMRRLVLPLAVIAIAACRHPDPASVAVEAVEAPSAPSPRQAGEPLRVVTYNIHHIDGERLAAALDGNVALGRADVILLQEVVRPSATDSSACVVARARGWWCAYAPGHGYQGGSLGVAIISRTPLAATEAIELPFFHVRFNAGRRVALAATVDVDGTPVRLYSVHLDNRLTPGQRVKQLAPVLDAAETWDGPALIAGDMNTSPFTWVGHVVPMPTGTQDDRLERYVRSRGFTAPVAGSGPPHQWLSMRLDAIYTRGLRVLDSDVEQTVRASDHLPLWADLLVAAERG